MLLSEAKEYIDIHLRNNLNDTPKDISGMVLCVLIKMKEKNECRAISDIFESFTASPQETHLDIVDTGT